MSTRMSSDPSIARYRTSASHRAGSLRIGLIVTKLRLRNGKLPDAPNSACRYQRCAVAVEILPRIRGVRVTCSPKFSPAKT